MKYRHQPSSTVSTLSDAEERNQLEKTGLIAFFLLACIFAVFWPVVHHDFVAWDDDINVSENPLLNPATARSIAAFWKGPYLRMYIPVTYTTWAWVAQFCRRRGAAPFALPPHPFHLVNFLIHLLSGLAAFGLLRELLKAGLIKDVGNQIGTVENTNRSGGRFSPDLAAAFGALFFALHPVQVEVVSWVSGLRDVLSGFGVLCALWQYVLFVSADRPAKAPPNTYFGDSCPRPRQHSSGTAVLGFCSRGRRMLPRAKLHYLAATAAFAAALLSKPSAIVIPAMAAVLDYGLLKRSIPKAARSLWFWFLLSAVFSILTQKSQGAAHIRAMVPLWERPLIAADTLAFYLYKLAVPFHLSPDYGRAPDTVIEKGWLYYTWLVPVALAGLIAWSRERRVYWSGAGLFAAGVLPVLGFVPFLHQDLSTVADRYLYLSMIGPAVVLAWHLARASLTPTLSQGERVGSKKSLAPWGREWSKGKWLWAASGVLLMVLGIRSRLQAEIWQNTGTLFGHIVALNPDSGVAHLNLGNYLQRHGKPEEAKFHFLETLRLRPGDGLALNNLGGLMAQQGRLDEAVSYFAQGLKNGVPDNVVGAHAGLGSVFTQQGKRDQAIDQFKQALRINPGRADIHHALAVLLADKGKIDEALAHEQWALQIRPDLRDIHKNIAMLLARQGHIDEARRHFALGLGSPEDSVEASAALCDSLQVHNDFDKAAACYQDIVRRAPSLAEARNALGFVLDKQGRTDEALRQYREAARLKPEYKQAQFNLGNILIRIGKIDEAIAALSGAVKAIPDAVEVRHNLGVALMQKGRRDEAVRQFQEVLKLKPDFEPSRRALNQISLK